MKGFVGPVEWAQCGICHGLRDCRPEGALLICRPCWTAAGGRPARLTDADRAYLRQKREREDAAVMAPAVA